MGPHYLNVIEKVLVPKNMPKPSVICVPKHFQYASSFLGRYQHLFISVTDTVGFSKQNNFQIARPVHMKSVTDKLVDQCLCIKQYFHPACQSCWWSRYCFWLCLSIQKLTSYWSEINV